MTAQEKLQSKTDQNLHICVGLDTDINKIPSYLKQNTNPVLEFNKVIIDSTYKSAAAYKINFAFYEREGLAGLENLQRTLEYIPKDVMVIADAKRGDIGNTAKMYAASVFEHFNFDSVTVNPYMGLDSVEPFLEYSDKIIYVLALTSNKSAVDFEKLKLTDGEYVFQEVISKVNEWNTKKNCGIVFGATNSDELKENISSFNDLSVLLPGIGAQGGSLEDVVTSFNLNNHSDYLVNISRALIYCNDKPGFGSEVEKVLTDYNERIKNISGY